MRRFAPAIAAFLVTLGAWPAAGESVAPTSFEFLGELSLPPSTEFAGEPVGGLSGIVWDAAREQFVALSDDHGERAPCRFYDLRLDLAALDREGTGVTVLGVHHLSDPSGGPCPSGEIDPEGFALAPGGGYFLSSEGIATLGVAPYVARLDAEGRELERFPLPPRYLPDGAGRRGVRQNLGFESLTVSPDGAYLVTGLENALVGDGPAADVGVSSPARLLVWRLGSDAAPREYGYEVGPVSRLPAEPGGLRVNGLVDLLALGDDRLLALEREWVAGVGHRIRLSLVELEPPLSERFATRASALGRTIQRPLVDFAALGRPLDNFEGMTFGPRLADGRRSLVVVSDDNFDAATQRTRFLVFAVDDAPLSVARIQGATHRSPMAGRWVVGVDGVVTAVDGKSKSTGFFLQSSTPDDDPATSEGMRVDWPAASKLAPGDRVRVDGRVVEATRGRNQLSVTTLEASAVHRTARGVELPAPVVVGSERRIPAQVDDDGLTRFEPANDAIDFWESLEGMRVLADGRRVTGPTLGYDELVLTLDQSGGEGGSDAGGNLLTPGGPALDRVTLSGRLVGGLPHLAVGSRLAQPIEGVVDYSYSNYVLLLTRPVTVASESTVCDATTRFWPDPERLRIATFNIENFSVADGKARIDRLATAIVTRLGAPEVLALEEVEDDSGKAGGDGVVSSRATLDALVAAIGRAGGPRYEWTAIDPELDREGGIPGGNIRVALLTQPGRVNVPRRGAAGPLDAVTLGDATDGPRFEPNPARVAPTSPAFTLQSGEGVRRSLAVEIEVEGAPWFLIVNHWSSKYDDGRPFGAVQPPPQPTAALRLAQSEVLRALAMELLGRAPKARLAVLGDFNDVPWSPAVEALAAPPLVSLTTRLPVGTRYSYNFEGAAQQLDHIVVSPALAADADVEIVHLNSDCPENLRTSDHDPVIASLAIRP